MTPHRKPIVLLPETNARNLLDEVQEEITLELWDGMTVPPKNLPDVEFFVPPGGFDRRALVRGLLPSMKRLKVLQLRTAGVDIFEPWAPPHVTVCNIRGVHNRSVPEWVVGMIIASYREFLDYFDAQRVGNRDRRSTDTVVGKTVLLVGYGEIGQAIDRALSALDVNIVRVASRARSNIFGPESLSGLVPDADVVVLVLPLTDESRGIMSADLLRRMRKGALFVNVSRGGLVDQDALVTEVRSGNIRAVLDAVDPEPLPIDHPLGTTRGIVYTPHVAAMTGQSASHAYEIINRQLWHLVAGEAFENVVRPGVVL